MAHIHGVDCACMDSDHPPPARGGSILPTAAHAHVDPAAPPASMSPFLQAQEVATRNVLAQVHPDVSLSRAAVTLVMRLQDCLAHALLARAFSGLNPAHRPGRDLSLPAHARSWGPDEDVADDPMFAAQESDPTHAVHWSFPEGLIVTELGVHALSEQKKAMAQFVRGEWTQEAPDSFQFGMPLAHRWWTDFHRGVEAGPDAAAIKAQARRRAQEKEDERERRTGKKQPRVKKSAEEASAGSAAAASAGAGAAPAESKEADSSASSGKASWVLFPDVLQQPVEQASLLALVEYLTAEVLELAGNRALDRGVQCIHVIDLYVCIAQDEELRQLVRYAHPSWSLRSIDNLPSPLDASWVPEAAPALSFGLPPVTYILEEEFAIAVDMQALLNKKSWYYTPAKVDEYARKFARGDMLSHPMLRALADMHVRPIQFLGCDERLVLSDKPDPDAQYNPSPADAFSFVIFAVEDGRGAEWHFLLEVAPHQSWKGCVSELRYAGSAIGYLARAVREGVDTLRVDLSACQNIGDDEGRTYEPHTNETDAIEADIVAQVAALKEKLDAHRRKMREARVARASTELEGQVSKATVSAVVGSIVEAVVEVAAQEEAKSADSSSVSSASSAAASSSASASAAAPVPAASSSSSSSSASAVSAAASSSSSSSSGSFDPFAIFAPPPNSAKVVGVKHNGVQMIGRSYGRGGAGAGADKSTASAASSSTAVVPSWKPPVVSLGSQQSLASLSALLGSVTAHSARSKVQGELEYIVARILHLSMFSTWGPTLYTHNHPEPVRRAFTVTLLDEAMQQAPPSAGLPQMPIVLLDLIAQFHSFDLPYIEEEAQAQLNSAGWLPMPATRQAYPGQRNNPVERLGQLSSEASELLDPIELEHVDDDEGDDVGDVAEGDEDEDDEDEDDEDEDDEEEDEQN